MSLYQKSYERVLKSYDKDLFVSRNVDGVLCVFRHSKRFEPVCETDGFRLLNLMPTKEYVFAITENWGLSGKQKDWGVDDLLNHIQRIDSLANERFLEEMDAENERVDESKKRTLRNEMEAFWSHERRRFAKATDHILTHSLSKDEPKKRLRDRRIKNGNY